ncbi:MAG: Spermidine synthase-like protein [uncultured bacterium]|nr:MAG: Spermidine synthase-like protein [uncultured bacterium]
MILPVIYDQTRNRIYYGIFFIALATLMLEILLLRIFSVTMWYHFAFMAISIALFGMSVGAVFVYFKSSNLNQKQLNHQLSASAFFFSLTTVISFIVYSLIPFSQPTFVGADTYNFTILTLIYLLISIPFIFSGICISLALTKLSLPIGKLYAADLIGSAAGSILIILVLNIMSGPTAIFAVACLASLASIFFNNTSELKNLKRAAAFLCLLFLLLSITNVFLTNKQFDIFRLSWIKGFAEDKQLYEKWNSFSRITVEGNKNELEIPFGWGMSAVYPQNKKINQLWLHIDSTAGTTITGFSGDLNKIDFLKYDIVNLVHYLRKDAEVLVVGSGGGRDILSALAFNQKSVLGVEVNNNIIKVVNEKYGDFSGHLDQYPQVRFINDEARSFMSRSKNNYDIIQVSLIDSWAATAAGAFVLTENSLYTIEAWDTFLQHLKPNGILTFSRWYSTNKPAEIYRLTSLASQSLKNIGILNPRGHIIIARRMREQSQETTPDGIGTILVSREPFSESDIEQTKYIAKQMLFEIVLSPKSTNDETLAALTGSQDTTDFINNYPLDISAPTDNNPFFFQMLRLKDSLRLKFLGQNDKNMNSMNIEAVTVIGILLIITFLLSLFFIIIPLFIKTLKTRITKFFPFLIYFSSIGLGFMLIEISQMQRLIIMLGHPIYGLSVLLFSLLLSSGIGSYVAQRIKDINIFKSAIRRVILIILVLTIFGFLTPYAIKYFATASTAIHILLAVTILFPIGFFMGMVFPLGIRLANLKLPNLTPLLWGINGATSVFASVLAVGLSLSFGISATFWTGVTFYLITFISLILMRKTAIPSGT